MENNSWNKQKLLLDLWVKNEEEDEKKNPYVPSLNISKTNKQCGNEWPMNGSAIDGDKSSQWWRS